MQNYESIRLNYQNPNDFTAAVRELAPQLPPGVGDQLLAKIVKMFSTMWYTDALERLNNRPLGEILADDLSDLKEPIGSGEVEGTKYRLYEARKLEQR